MTAAVVNVESREVMTTTGIINETLFARFVKFAGVSENSQKTYTKAGRQLFKFFSANGIVKPTRENLVEWIESLKAEGKTASTVNLYLSAAKIFFRWTSQEGIYANIADHIKSGLKPSRGHKKDALDVVQCKALVDNVKGGSLKDLRDRGILSLMVTAGVRTVEIVRANVGDIRFERGRVYLYVVGKGHNDADEKVLLAKQAHQAIKAYLAARGKVQSTDPLFVSTSRRCRNARLQTQTISRMVKAKLRDIGLDSPRLTAHSLRHAVATNLIFAGVELPKVQMVLRHQNLSTTMIYAAAWERYTNLAEQTLADQIFSH